MPLPDFYKNMKGGGKRSTFVIDREGRIQYAEVLENAAEEPNYWQLQIA
jgi:glutaredoxin-dependent peroxiredoxin